MIGLQIIWLGTLLVAVPLWIGHIFDNVNGGTDALSFRWISGQMVLWAGFQLLCVPLVLLERTVTELTVLFGAYMVILLLAATIVVMWRRKNAVPRVRGRLQRKKSFYVAWAVFGVLLAFQLVQAVLLTYGDGDDAFYVAEATYAVDADDMYMKNPYTGLSTVLDVRHGLAPFPIWISFLSKVTGVRTVSVAHVLLPLALIVMTYVIYYLMGCKLLGKRKEYIPVFLIFTELLVVFGDYSFYTAENFMLARSRQGKAALGSIMIPTLVFLLFLLLEKLQESQKITVGYWILLACTLTAGCLCSTLGALLVCMLVGITGLCAAFCYRKWSFLIPMASCCVPCVIYACLYLLLV